MQELAENQLAALDALLDGSTVTFAAECAGVSPRTVHRWLQEPEFQTERRNRRRAVLLHYITDLQPAIRESVATLRAVLADTEAPASARVSAARAIFQYALESMEIDDLNVKMAEIDEAWQSIQESNKRRW